MKILVVKIGAIGDVLRTTSLLPGLAEKYRPAEIDWLTSEASRELLEWNSYLRRVFTWEERDSAEAYDLVIGLEDDKDVCRFIRTLNTEKVVGAYLEKGKVVYTPSAWFDMSMISKFGLAQANVLKKKNQKSYQQHMADLLGIKVSPYVLQQLRRGRTFPERPESGPQDDGEKRAPGMEGEIRAGHAAGARLQRRQRNRHRPG